MQIELSCVPVREIGPNYKTLVYSLVQGREIVAATTVEVRNPEELSKALAEYAQTVAAAGKPAVAMARKARRNGNRAFKGFDALSEGQKEIVVNADKMTPCPRRAGVLLAS